MRSEGWRNAGRWLARIGGISLAGWALVAAAGWAGTLGWIAEAGANFRVLPVLAAGAAVGVLGWSMGRWAAALGGLVLAVVVGFTLVSPPRLAGGASEGKSLKFATWNAYLGNLDPAAAVRWIEANDPDVIAFTEISKPLHKALAKLLGRRFAFYLGNPRNGPGGLAVFSRVPMANWHRPARDAKWASFDLTWPGGRGCRVILTHPPSPTRAAWFAARADVLRMVAAEVRGSSAPVVVFGDLNATWASLDFREFCGTTGLVPATGWRGSWPAFLPAMLRIGIDHVLANPRDFESVATAVGNEGAGSDHLPVMAEIRMRSTSGSSVR